MNLTDHVPIVVTDQMVSNFLLKNSDYCIQQEPADNSQNGDFSDNGEMKVAPDDEYAELDALINRPGINENSNKYLMF